MGLGVGDHELRVVDRRSTGAIGRDIQERLGEIHAERNAGNPCRSQGGSAAPATSVEHRRAGFELHACEQRIGDGLELAVVAVGVRDVVHRLGAVPGLWLLLVRGHGGSPVCSGGCP